MRKNLRDECYKETESRCEEMYVSWLEKRVFSLESAVEKFTCAQHTQPKICPTCSGHGSYNAPGDNYEVDCSQCSGTGKLQASAS